MNMDEGPTYSTKLSAEKPFTIDIWDNRESTPTEATSGRQAIENTSAVKMEEDNPSRAVSETTIQRGKSDSVVVNRIKMKNRRKYRDFLSIGLNTEEELPDDGYVLEKCRSSASSASHHGLSFSIAGPVMVPGTNFGHLSDSRRQSKHKTGSRFRDHEAIRLRRKKSRSKEIPAPISLKFADVRYKVVLETAPKVAFFGGPKEAKVKEILYGITGHVSPGEMLALMGPSGSGKTTALNILSGRIAENTQGTILYNDQPFTKALKGRTGFVMQEDILFPHLTVRETLIYAALLKLPNSLTKKQKIQRANDVIYDLSLERCQDNIIGEQFQRGISGGEKKRVCVGHEILTDPSLLFLDEPTSGLDSTAALRTMQTICDIAKDGRTVIATIHQPSSRLFHLFDKLLLLTGGHLIYFGKATNAMDYFSGLGFFPSMAMNPADFLLDLANGCTNGISVPEALLTSDFQSKKLLNSAEIESSRNDVKEFLVATYVGILVSEEKLYPKHETSKDVIMKHEWSTTWCQQFLILLIRGVKERKNEYLNSIRVFQVLASAIIAGLLWWDSPRHGFQDQVGLLFFTTVYWSFMPLFIAIFTFPQEKAMLAKERASNMYRLSAYFMARTLGDLPLEILLPIAYLLIIYFMAHLQYTITTFVYTLLAMLLNVVTAQGLGLAIGAIMMDVKKATALASILLLVFMLTGGFYVEHMPPFASWSKYLSFNYYTFKLLIKIQYHGRKEIHCTNGNCIDLQSMELKYGISLDGGFEEVWPLIILALGYRLMAYLALRLMRLRL